MPKFPWTARPDASPAEDASLGGLLAGDEALADGGAGLRPVADVLAALTASPGRDELTGLAAAQAEFRRHVVPAQARRSRRWRPASLVSRLGLRLGTATAVVVVGLGGAAAAGYADALPACWQQFAHATIGAPERGTGHGARAATSSARSAPRPDSPRAHQPHSEGPPARHASRHHTRSSRHARLPAGWPFLHRGWPPPTPAVGRWPLPARPVPAAPVPTPEPTAPVPTPEPTEPVATPDASPSNT
jgi:hypothetical protein